MKKFIILFLINIFYLNIRAQVILRYDFSQRPLTARSVGLGNASAALADDASALHINPAGLAGIRRINFVFSTDAVFREANLKDNGGVPNLYRNDVNKIQPAIALNQAALAIPLIRARREAAEMETDYSKVIGGGNGSPLVLALGYARQGSNLNFKEEWDVVLKSGSNTLRDLYTWNDYGNTQMLSAGLSAGLVKKYTSSFSFGFSVNRIFSSRHAELKRQTLNNGTATSNSTSWEEITYNGTMLGWGLTYTTRQASVAGYYRESMDMEKVQYFDSAKSCLIISLSGNTPYSRNNRADYSNGTSTSTYTTKPGNLTMSLAYRIVNRQYAYTDETYDWEIMENVRRVKGVAVSTVTPVLQFEMVNLDRNRVYNPFNGTVDSSLVGMSSNRLSMGVEFYNSLTRLSTRLGYAYQQYARKNSSFVENPGKQMATHSLCAGIGGNQFDLGLRFEFFKHQRVIYWNNGSSGLDYRGTAIHLCMTFKFFQKPETVKLID